MASIYDLKPKFQSLLRPITRWLAVRRVTANQVTASATVLSLVAGITIGMIESRYVLLLLPIVLFVRMALNAIDGMLAREHDQKSRLGAILNEIGDVVSDVGLYLPIIFHLEFSTAVFMFVFVTGGLIAEYCGVVAVMVGSPRRYEGPMGKSDRAFAIGLLATLLTFSAVPPNVISGFLGILIFLSFLTAMNRARRALSHTTNDTSN